MPIDDTIIDGVLFVTRKRKPGTRPTNVIDTYFGTDTVTLLEAALIADVNVRTLRKAIKEGRLKAFIPGGRDARNCGAGQGWRIHKADLQAYVFGEESVPKGARRVSSR